MNKPFFEVFITTKSGKRESVKVHAWNGYEATEAARKIWFETMPNDPCKSTYCLQRAEPRYEEMYREAN